MSNSDVLNKTPNKATQKTNIKKKNQIQVLDLDKIEKYIESKEKKLCEEEVNLWKKKQEINYESDFCHSTDVCILFATTSWRLVLRNESWVGNSRLLLFLLKGGK